MNPIVTLLAGRALRFVLASPKLLPMFAAHVKAFKAERLTDAAVQAMPDDEAAIKALSDRIDLAERENQALQARLSARAKAEQDDDGA